MSDVQIALGTKARMALAQPNDVKLTMTITMSAAEWRGLAAELPDDGTNAGRLHKMIRRLVDTMTHRITVDMETTGYSLPSAVTGSEAAPC